MPNLFNKNQYVVMQITGVPRNYIAKIVSNDPLVLKVCEKGLYSKLKPWDYIINTAMTADIQRNCFDFLRSCKTNNRVLSTGLKEFRPLLAKGELFQVSYYWLDMLLYRIRLIFTSKD